MARKAILICNNEKTAFDFYSLIPAVHALETKAYDTGSQKTWAYVYHVLAIRGGQDDDHARTFAE